MLSQLLYLQGIESVVLEARQREYVESRIRAGVLEQASVELLDLVGVSGRLHAEGLVHHGVEIRFSGRSHRIPLTDLSGRSITVYGQQEVVKDLIAARLAAGGDVRFGCQVLGVRDVEGDRPVISYTREEKGGELACDLVAGCDGFHGASRPSLPRGALKEISTSYPFGWLGIVAEVAPSTEELIYSRHERGFALHSLRSPELSRLYVQCRPDEDIAEWPDERIWEELRVRLGVPGWELSAGPIIDKSVSAVHAYVCEPMQYGRVFLAGDAAHIVPPTGAKGLNLALADVAILAEGISRHIEGDDEGLRSYSASCLSRVWSAQRFAAWMTSMLHVYPGASGYEERLRDAELDHLFSSKAASTALAEAYVGPPLVTARI